MPTASEVYEPDARIISAAPGAAAERHGDQSAISVDQLVRFLVAAVDGLILQYAVHHDAEQSPYEISNVCAAAVALTRLDTRSPS